MTTALTRRRLARLTVSVLLALACIAPGCGRPPDETWLRVLQFEDESANVIASVSSVVQTITTTTTSGSTQTTREVGATDFVNVVFANQSSVVGTSGQAGGVTIDEVRISYSIAGYSPPDVSSAVTLYVPVSTVDGTTTTAKLSVALVSTALKSWLVATVPESAVTNGLYGSARLVFHARTDAGGEVETESGINIVFENDLVTVSE